MRWLPVLLAALPLAGQPGPAARSWRQSREPAIVREFAGLLAVPNVAADPPALRRNASHIARMLEARGIAWKLLETAGAPPAVYGEIRTPGARTTLLFYAHYDGQPVEPGQWTGGDPFRPRLRLGSQALDLQPAGGRFDPEARIYARSAGDDKAAIIAILSGLDALRAAKIPLRSNIKLFFEGEEEAGSPHLGQVASANRDLLAASLWLFCDGPVHQSGRPQIVFGARGVAGLNVTVYGPRRELHSGHYGNWAPNPAMMLAQLLASMKDPEGRVLIPDFYKGIAPLSATERQALAAIPDIDGALRKELLLARTEGGRVEASVNEPSLNIRGLASGAVGAQSRNVVPSTAAASLDIRLVKGIDHDDAVRRLTDHIRRQGYFVVVGQPSAEQLLAHPRVARLEVSRGGYNAVRTSMDLDISKRVVAAVEAAHGPVVKLPTLCGSLPLAVLEQVLNVPMIVIPVSNYDNNQHSHNENLRLQNLWDGIETMAALLAME